MSALKYWDSTSGTWKAVTGAVSSVFGRSGDVVAASGDYSSFYQPLDSDLTAIATVSTQSFGRGALAMADAASFRSYIGTGTGTGDLSSNTTTSANGELILFADTTGKMTKRTSGNFSAGLLTITSLGIVGTIADSHTNWDTAFTQTREWDGGATGLVAATGRTSLGLGSIALEDGTTDLLLTSAQTITPSDSGTSNVINTLSLGHNSTGTPLANFGAALLFRAKSDTTVNRTAADISAYWQTPADATRAGILRFRATSSGSFVNSLLLFPSGGASFNSTTDPGNAVNAPAFKVSNVALGYQHMAGTFATMVASGSPTGTTSASGVMMGLGRNNGFVITPAISGKILVNFTGYMNTSSTTNATLQVASYYGTGTGPLNGAAATGTGFGAVILRSGTYSIANSQTPFHMSGIITGLAIGTQIWLDLILAVNGGTGSMAVYGNAVEIP